MVEEQAAEAGYFIHVDSAYLAPARGLAVRIKGAALYEEKDAPTPLATLGNGLVELSWGDFLFGKVSTKLVTLSDVVVRFPVPSAPGEHLTLKAKDLAFLALSDEILGIGDADIDVEGISIRIGGLIKQEKSGSTGPSDEKPSEPYDLSKDLDTIRPYVDIIHKELAGQAWKEKEFPSLDIQAKLQGPEQEFQVRLSVPKWDIDPFHFQRGTAELTFRKNGVHVDNLEVDTDFPEGHLKIQGAYNNKTREVGVYLTSNISLLRLADLFKDQYHLELLDKFHHDDGYAPVITISGNIALTEKYTPEELNLSVGIIQEKLSIGESTVEKMELSLGYGNGDFIIDQCRLELEGGCISLTANAKTKEKEGKAILDADIDVGALLRLASEFTPAPLHVPDYLQLGGKTKFHLESDLDVTDFTPEEGDWGTYIPGIRNVEASLSVDNLGISGCAFHNPELALKVEGITQDENKIPTKIRETALSLKVGKAGIPLGEGCDRLQAEGVIVTWKGCDVILDDLLYAAPDISISTATLTTGADSITFGEYTVLKPDIKLGGITSLRPLEKWDLLLDTADLTFTTQGAYHQGVMLGAPGLTAHYTGENPYQAAVTISYTPPNGAPALTLDFTPYWANPDTPTLQDIKLEGQDLTGMAPLLEHWDISTEGIQLPRSATFTGNLLFHVPTTRLVCGSYSLQIPELVRKSSNIPVYAGKSVSLAIDSSGSISTTLDHQYDYNAGLSIFHNGKESGYFKAKVVGRNAKFDLIEGECTIRPDIVDQLIDNGMAHEIIRDFRMKPATVTRVSQLGVNVDLSGTAADIRATVEMHAHASNFGYIFNAFSDTPDGKETLRSDLGADPFAYINKASCNIMVNCEYGRRPINGKKQPDICKVTISNAVIDYDNMPWLLRNRFTSGPHQSTLTGDAIIIDVSDAFVMLKNVRGRVYPDYSLGMFYPDLVWFMKDLSIPTPFMIQTRECVFPYLKRSPKPYSGTISMESASEFRLNMFGTAIPFENFSGFIHLDAHNVLLDRMTATCWQGVANAIINFGFNNSKVSIDGYADASCVDLKSLAAAYGSEQSPALCDARIRFRGASLDTDAIQAYGEASIRNGNLLRLKIFTPITDIVSLVSNVENGAAQFVGSETVNKWNTSAIDTVSVIIDLGTSSLESGAASLPLVSNVVSYSLNDAKASFIIENGHLYTTFLKAAGTNLSVDASFDLNLNTMYLDGDLWPRFSGMFTIPLAPMTLLSDIVDIRVFGNVNELKRKFGRNKLRKSGRQKTLTLPEPSAPATAPSTSKPARKGTRKR